MNLTCGIIGRPYCGKSTLFSLLTGERGHDPYGIVKGFASVRDPRIERLSEVYKPVKTTFAQVQYIDVPGIQDSQGRKGEAKILENVRNAHSLLAVINGFEKEKADPGEAVSAIKNLIDELLINDLILVENRLDKIKHKRTPEEKAEFILFEKLKELLESDVHLRDAALSPEEIKAVRGFQFYTLKPLIFVVNLHESSIPDSDAMVEAIKAQVQLHENSDVIALSAKIEEEIAMLPFEDRGLFMEDLDIIEPATEKVIRATYDLLGLISFFTAGEDEVKAWTIVRGTAAKQAAGEIHSDIERGFIKAELVSYEDFTASGCDMKKVRESGHLRLEGKEYTVVDGDIINYKFNV